METNNVKIVQVYENCSPEEFKTSIEPKRCPTVLRNLNLGPCLEKWTSSYLLDKLNPKEVRAHVTTDPAMDFRAKNFKYCSLDIRELVRRCSQPLQQEYLTSPSELYYLRSLSTAGPDPRSMPPVSLMGEFPEIADDFIIPQLFDAGRLFSSVLRVSSGHVQVWTHYDVMDNVYCQIVGHKRAVLWAPHDALNLYLDGDKSTVINIDHQDENEFPRFKDATKYVANLGPGDVLFIPAFWFHNMKAEDFGVAINVFWKELEPGLYDQKDPYGNKDLVPGARSLRMLDNVIKQLDTMPAVYRDFYARRLVSKIQQKCYLELGLRVPNPSNCDILVNPQRSPFIHQPGAKHCSDPKLPRFHGGQASLLPGLQGLAGLCGGRLGD